FEPALAQRLERTLERLEFRAPRRRDLLDTRRVGLRRSRRGAGLREPPARRLRRLGGLACKRLHAFAQRVGGFEERLVAGGAVFGLFQPLESPLELRRDALFER